MFFEILLLDHLLNDDDEFSTYEPNKEPSPNECKRDDCKVDSIIRCPYCKKTFCMKHINVDQHGCSMPSGIKKKSRWRFWE